MENWYEGTDRANIGIIRAFIAKNNAADPAALPVDKIPYGSYAQKVEGGKLRVWMYQDSSWQPIS